MITIQDEKAKKLKRINKLNHTYKYYVIILAPIDNLHPNKDLITHLTK